MYHAFIVFVADRPGVLSRVTSRLRRLNCNIVSLTLGRCERPSVSRMTIVINAPQGAADRIPTAIDKLEDVLRVEATTVDVHQTREIALIKVAANVVTDGRRSELLRIFRAHVVEATQTSVTFQLCTSPTKIDHFLESLAASNDEVLEIARSGAVAMSRGLLRQLPEGGKRHSPHKMRVGVSSRRLRMG